jgi:hypothetical protein
VSLTKLNVAFTIVALIGILIIGAALADAGDETQAKIARAMSAGPTDIAGSARIVDTDAQGKSVVLREGTNGFTCMPGNPKIVGDPPMCADAVSMQWAADFKAHKPKPTNTRLASPICSRARRRGAIQIPTTLLVRP